MRSSSRPSPGLLGPVLVALVAVTVAGSPAAAATPTEPVPTDAQTGPAPTDPAPTGPEPVDPEPVDPGPVPPPDDGATAPPDQEPACTADAASQWIPRESAPTVRLGAAQAQALPGLRVPITVAVVDTGISTGNPHLDPALLAPVDLTQPEPNDSPDARRARAVHGTQVAAMIAARDLRPGQPSGLVGVAPTARVQPVVFATSEETEVVANRITSDTLAAGIRAATETGAQVINVSYSQANPSAQLEAAVADAVAAGALVVASTGNERVDADRYPAAYPGVLGVAPVDGADLAPASSPQGPAVDLAAPGHDIVGVSPFRDCRFSTADDAPSSSWATAYVSGAAALVWSFLPGAGAEEVAYRLTASADRPRRDARDDATGWGVVQPYAAITMTIDPQRPGPVLPGQPVPEPTPVAADPIAAQRTVDTMADARRDVVRWGLVGVAALGLLLMLTRWNRLRRSR